MSIVSSSPSGEGPLQPSSGRAVASLVFGIVALVAFSLLALPTDLLLFDASGIPILGAVAATLYPLALGPEILLSPVGLVPAVAAIMIGGHRTQAVPGARNPSAALARTGPLLGWVVVALYALSLVLVILSFLGVLKPLI